MLNALYSHRYGHVVPVAKRFDERCTKKPPMTTPQADSPAPILFKDGRTDAFIFCNHLRRVRLGNAIDGLYFTVGTYDGLRVGNTGEHYPIPRLEAFLPGTDHQFIAG